MTASNALDKAVQNAVQEGRTTDAVALLFDAIVEHAKAGNFKQAEQLRDRLFHVDEMAINEIVKSGELIEAAKSKSMDLGYRDLWPNLFDALEPDEVNALFYDAQKMDLDTDQELMRQTQINNKLFFIYSGQVNITCLQAGVETFVKSLQPGNIVGQDTFFGLSSCTYSLRTKTPATVFVLDREILKTWKTKVPNLATKLRDHCATLESMSRLIKSQGVNRRMAERIPLAGAIDFQLLDHQGQTMTQVFRAELLDMSVSGAAFGVRTPNQDTLTVLLGRQISMRIPINTAQETKQVRMQGVIMGISLLGFSEYAVHLRFEKAIPVNQFQIFTRALGAAKRTSEEP